MTGRIDVHSHLLPGIDDGCANLEESLLCARELVAAGYTHSFCTPHIWPSLPNNTVAHIVQWTASLQKSFDKAKIPLKLIPGGELNLRPELAELSLDEMPTFGMSKKYLLADLWAERLPTWFEPTIRAIQAQGATVILAHPERMRAIQDQPSLARELRDMGLLLQGNLQCLGDPPETHTRRTIERFLRDQHYFMLGSDLHNLKSLPLRLNGLQRAIELMGEDKIAELTIANPSKLLS